MRSMNQTPCDLRQRLDSNRHAICTVIQYIFFAMILNDILVCQDVRTIGDEATIHIHGSKNVALDPDIAMLNHYQRPTSEFYASVLYVYYHKENVLNLTRTWAFSYNIDEEIANRGIPSWIDPSIKQT